MCAAIAVQAAAHTPGAQPVTQTGTVVLAPSGTNNSSLDAYVSAFGFPIAAGDTLDISWSVNNGSGPFIDFSIHTHENGYTRYYANSTNNESLLWTVPQAGSPFMFSWANPTAVNVTLSYRIVDIAPPPDITPLVVLPLAVGAAFGWFLWLRAARGPEEQAGPAEGAGKTDGELDRDATALDDEAFQRAVDDAERAKGGGT